MTIETSIEDFGTFQMLRVTDTILQSAHEAGSVELDGPEAWALYQKLESFIKDPKTKFPEAILAFEFDEGFAGEDPMPNHAWEPHLLSPCCGSEVDGVYAEQEAISLNIEEVHDGTVWLNSSDGDGNTLLYICSSCYLGVSIPDYLDLNWG